VTSPPGNAPEVILGPPGTGKTTTLLGLVEAELAGGVVPDRVGFVTFTRRAAEEAVSRACARFELQRDELPYFRTLHSLCYRALGLSRGDVLDGRRLQGDFADYAGVKITGRWSDDGTLSGYEMGDRLLFRENLSRVRMISLREQYELDADGLRWRELERVAEALASFKEQQGLCDYTDMLQRFVDEGGPPKLEVLFVDEAQDLSRLQWEVVRTLATTTRRVVVAGDDDQAIYAWAGADAAALVRMGEGARVLGQSWRCPREVQDLGLVVIAGVSERRPKTWAPREGGGQVSRAPSFAEVGVDQDWVDDVQPVLVLARNEFVLREHVEPELRLRGVLYERTGGGLSVAPRTLNAIVAWEDLRAGRAVTAREARAVYGLMSSGVGVARGFKELSNFEEAESVSMADLKERGGLLIDTLWHEALDRLPPAEVSYVLACLRNGEKLRYPQPRVRISTIHGSKGGEARHVVLFKEMARRTHREMEADPDSERRVWYVGVTRARERLTLVGSSTRLECPWL
jgi:DNA helicase-2/ATP-dependent DNA helicase PcrA